MFSVVVSKLVFPVCFHYLGFFFLMPVTRVRPDPDDVSDVAGTVLFEGRQLEKVSRAPVEKLW